MCAFWFHIKDTNFNSFSFFHSFSFFYSLSISSLWTIWNSLLVWLNNHHNHCNHLHSLSQFPDYTSQISMLHLKICHLGTQELTVTESTFFSLHRSSYVLFCLANPWFSGLEDQALVYGTFSRSQLDTLLVASVSSSFYDFEAAGKVNGYWHLDWLFLQDIFISSLDILIILPSYILSI